MNPEDDLNISHEDLRTILTRPIAFHRLFADIAGSVGGGVFLSQLYYWSEKTDDPQGWIYKTAAEWYDETMLGRRELDSIRKVLKEKGIIKEKLAGVPATVHYKIEWNELFYRLKLSAQERREQITESRTNQFGVKRQTEEKDKLDGAKSQTSLAENANLLIIRDFFREYSRDDEDGDAGGQRKTHCGSHRRRRFYFGLCRRFN